MRRTFIGSAAAVASWLVVGGSALACDPVDGQSVTLTKGVVGAVEAGSDFDSGKALWFVNVKDGDSSNGCLVDAVEVSSEPKTCQVDSRFEVTGTFQAIPDLVSGGEAYHIVVPELVCE